MNAHFDCGHRTFEDSGNLFVAQLLVHGEYQSFTLQFRTAVGLRALHS